MFQIFPLLLLSIFRKYFISTYSNYVDHGDFEQQVREIMNVLPTHISIWILLKVLNHEYSIHYLILVKVHINKFWKKINTFKNDDWTNGTHVKCY